MRNTLCKTFGNCVLYSVFCFVSKLVATLPLIINGSKNRRTHTRYTKYTSRVGSCCIGQNHFMSHRQTGIVSPSEIESL